MDHLLLSPGLAANAGGASTMVQVEAAPQWPVRTTVALGATQRVPRLKMARQSYAERIVGPMGRPTPCYAALKGELQRLVKLAGEEGFLEWHSQQLQSIHRR